jgi:hemoglobin
MNDQASLYERLGGREKLAQLLRHFYADVRQHKLLGPLFAEHIHDWPKHLELIADFWSTIAGGPPVYAGRMPVKHVPLGLREEHFTAWLGLWEHHCKAWLTPECAAELIQLAHTVAARLRIICGVTSPTGSDFAFAPRSYGSPLKPFTVAIPKPV